MSNISSKLGGVDNDSLELDYKKTLIARDPLPRVATLAATSCSREGKREARRSTAITATSDGVFEMIWNFERQVMIHPEIPRRIVKL